MTRLRTPAVVLLCCALAPALVPRLAPANAIVAPDLRWGPRAGPTLAEPSFRDVTVEGESVVLDLRPLEAGDPAEVVAEYRLRNETWDGPAFGDMRGPATVRAWVLFVTPGMLDGGARLDDTELFVAPVAVCGLQPEWAPPAEVPAPDGGALRFRTPTTARTRWCGAGRRAVEAFRFHLSVPPGEHVLRVAYRVEPGRAGAALRTLAFVFGRPDGWSGFGPVRVEVLLPPFWQAAASPPLGRDGDRLAATFERLPANALGLSARPSAERWNPWARRLPWIAAAAGLTLLLGLVTAAVFRRGRAPARGSG